MNKPTKKSEHPYHHVIIGKDQKHVILCVCNFNGYGGYDMWKVDRLGHKRVHGFTMDSFFNDYWQDMVELEVIQNVYNVLDFYVEKKDNVVELQSSNDFTADDIPF